MALPLDDGGRSALGNDRELPLERFYQPGVKLDSRHFSDGYLVLPRDIDEELSRIGRTLAPLEIVLVNTKAGERCGCPDYVDSGCGMGRDATLHALNKGVRVVGTDGWSWDVPFKFTAERLQQTGDASIIWEAHEAAREIAYCQIEKLHGLDALPCNGFLYDSQLT